MRNALQEWGRYVDFGPRRSIEYVTGDATKLPPPQPREMRFLVHCCNDIGAWGSGFVIALSNAWPETELAYQAWWEDEPTIYETTGPLQLGEVQFVQVPNNIVVCNMVGQRSIRMDSNGPPVRYDAIRMGLAKIRMAMGTMQRCKFNCSFYSPKFGADRAGGDWNVIAVMINDMIGDTGIPSTVYEWKPSD